MAKAKKTKKSKKSSVQVRDLKTSKDPKGGIIAVLGPQRAGGSGKIKFNE